MITSTSVGRSTPPPNRAQSIANFAATIKPVSEGGAGYFKGVFYALNKVGKTRFGASSGLKTLIIETEPSGTETLLRLDLPNVTRSDLRTWQEIEAAFWYLHTGQHDYEVVVIDTISMLNSFCLRYVMGQEQRLDPLMPKGDHYNKASQIMDNEILRWVALPMHVVFLAQQRNLKTKLEDGEEVLQQIAPDLTPHTLGTLLGAVGTIGHLRTHVVEIDGKKQLQRRMLLETDKTYVAGTRINGMPRIIVEPTLEQILRFRDSHGEADSIFTLVDEAEEAEAAAAAAEVEPGTVTDDGFVAI